MGYEFYLAAMIPALLWGFSPIVSKRAMASGGNFFQASATLVGVSFVLYTAILLATRDATTLFSGYSPHVIGVFLTGGVIGTTIGRLCGFMGVDQVGASITSAAVSTRPLFSAVLAVALLGERVTLQSGSGILLVVVGLIVLGTSKGGDLRGWSPRDLGFPLMAAIAFGVGGVIRRYGFLVSTISPLEAVALNELGSLVTLGLWIGLVNHRRLITPLRSYGFMFVSACLSGVALYSMFYALRLGPVVIVDPLTSSAPLFTTLFSYLFLKDLERVTGGVILGALLVVVGVVLITTV